MCKTLRDMNAYNEHEGNDSFGTELFKFMQWYISKEQSARAILQTISSAISEITIKINAKHRGSLQNNFSRNINLARKIV